jgi:uncharacterized protein (UPF0332 family)
VRPEAARYLEKARRLLQEAQSVAAIGLADAAGRAAYLAAFHAAQAIIFERTGGVVRTHRGVHARFAALAKGESKIAPELLRFLARAYNLKAVADYDTGPNAQVSIERALAAMETAERFVATVAEVIGTSDDG